MISCRQGSSHRASPGNVPIIKVIGVGGGGCLILREIAGFVRQKWAKKLSEYADVMLAYPLELLCQKEMTANGNFENAKQFISQMVSDLLTPVFRENLMRRLVHG